MKKSFLGIAALAALFLGACTAKTEVAPTEITSEISEVTESESSSDAESSSEEAVVYTAEGVMQDICNAIFGSAVAEDDYLSDGEGGFYTGINFGSDHASEEYLEVAVTTTASYLPEYVSEVSAPAAGTWSDGEAGYFASYGIEGSELSIQIGSYIYNSNLCAQVNVF